MKMENVSTCLVFSLAALDQCVLVGPSTGAKVVPDKKKARDARLFGSMSCESGMDITRVMSA